MLVLDGPSARALLHGSVLSETAPAGLLGMDTLSASTLSASLGFAR
jgi:hypothetical protein